MAFATFLVWRLRTGACGVGACGFWRYGMAPVGNERVCACSKSKKRGTKKDALLDEENKRLSTMAEEDDEDEGITIKVGSIPEEFCAPPPRLVIVPGSPGSPMAPGSGNV